MHIKNFFRLTILLVGLTFVQIWAQQEPDKPKRPKVREPYDVKCQTKEERCKKCRMYELELQFMAGKLTKKEYHDKRTQEEIWLNTECRRDTNPPPDDCWGKRNFYLTRLAKEQVFEVCQNHVVAGKCQKSKDCVEVLRFQAGRDLGRRHESFRVIFLPTTSEPSRDSHLPFTLPNHYFDNWAKASSKPERPADPFFIFLPDGKSDTVWMLKPRSPGSLEAEAVVLPEFKASWFNLGGAKDERIGIVVPFLEGVSTVLANDPNARLERISPANDTTQLVVTLHGNVKGNHFLVSTGFSSQDYLGEYEPIKHESGAEFSSLIIPSLVGEHLDNRLLSMINAWKSRQANYQVVAAAPFGSGDTPFRAIGSPVGQSCEETLRRQLRGGLIDLLVKSNNNYFVWRHGGTRQEKVEWFGDLVEHFKPNCFLRQLAIADPKLKVLAASHDAKSGLNKLVFIYSKNPGVVYGWSWKDEQAPSEKILMRDGQRFELSGEPVAPYIASLRTSISSGERDFLLRLADQSKNFYLLDLFFSASPAERILLYASDLPRSDTKLTHTVIKVHRLAASGAMPDIFLKALGSKNQSWTDFQTLYMGNGGWQRSVFIEKLAKTTLKMSEAWLSTERMGIVLGLDNGDAHLSIHLPEPRRSPFGPAYFSRIRETIQDDGLIYIAGNAPNHPDELLQSCLQQTWDRKVWRANPLGYFDRCKTL